MRNPFLAAVGTVAAFGLIASTPVQATNFGDFMNPGKWFGGNKNRDWDDYYGRGYGYPGHGYGYPGYGYGYPGYGHGYPGYGYGYPGYGYPGYGAPAQGGSGTTQAPPPTPQ